MDGLNLPKLREMADIIKMGGHAVVEHNAEAKWLIKSLATEGVPVQSVNLGGGVKKIFAGTPCPHCKGKGYTNG